MPLRHFRRQYEQSSLFEKRRIIGMMEAGWSARQVARQLGRSDCVARRCWDQWFQEMSFTRRPGSGCPQHTSCREDCHIVRNAHIQPTASSASIQARGSAGMCHLKKLHTLTNSFLRQIVNASWFVRNEVIYRDLKIKPFLPHIKDLSKRFFDKLPSVPNELISNQPAYDLAVPLSQKRPRALLDHEFINFPQAKRLRA
ncbi:transposable element Tcb2 transposase [Trichonephila clavipes]|nr:transposable element Tcb2 transposase [Trichonephila clavipes]